ncbi:MAG: DUF1232 domain-containing protein [Bacteroidaceae bacterium]|nr:DUF1232 domain-containing protein [Bacteroidaceae bacterium]
MKITETMLKPLVERLQKTDWKGESQKVLSFLRKYALRAGRIAAKPLLQFYYVMTDENVTARDKALIYGSLLYILVPGDIIPRRVFNMLGIMDDIGAVMIVYTRIKNKITPAINFKVEETLDEWFGTKFDVV